VNDLGPALDSSRTAAEIAVLVDGSIEGAGDAAVRGIETVEHAVEGDLTFIGDARHARHWADSKASVALVTRELDLGDWDSTSRSVIRVEDADQAMIQMLELIESAAAELADHPAAGVHPDARVDPTATIADDATVGPFVVIGPRCRVGSDACIESGARIYADAVIEDGVHLHANVTIRERCVVGARSILHAGVVIGSDGFGYRPAPDGRGLRKIPHVGHVEIGEEVEIGANSCVDRGKFGATRVGAGTKIDNLCQIGHNVEIGRCVVMSGLTGVAGSTRIGDGCRIGGGCGIADHLVIGRGVNLAARSGLMTDIPAGETWGGFPAQELRSALREVALIRKLPEWHRQLKHLLETPKAR